MKAWFVWAGEPYMEWGDYVHGETPGKAKAMFMKAWHTEVEWNDLHPHRYPALDDKPITYQNIFESGQTCDRWVPICECEICNNDLVGEM